MELDRIVCNSCHKPLGCLFIQPLFYALKIQEYVQVQDIMPGILQIFLGSTTSLLFYVPDMCIYSSLKYVCKNVPKMQEPIKILGTRGVNMKQVPYCGPINIRCPGTIYFALATGLAVFVQSGYYFYFFLPNLYLWIHIIKHC